MQGLATICISKLICSVYYFLTELDTSPRSFLIIMLTASTALALQALLILPLNTKWDRVDHLSRSLSKFFVFRVSACGSRSYDQRSFRLLWARWRMRHIGCIGSFWSRVWSLVVVVCARCRKVWVCVISFTLTPHQSWFAHLGQHTNPYLA
jgi:hypothetical protein